MNRSNDRSSRLTRLTRLTLGLGCALLAIACSTKRVSRDGPPQRIITLTPSVTEIALALGARDRLVAVDRFSRESPDVAELADVSDLPIAGDFIAPNVEVIARLKPDLIILDDAQAKAAASLNSAGYKTVSVKMHSIGDVRAALSRIADAIGAKEKGALAAAEIDRAIAAAAEREGSLATPPRVLWIIDRAPDRLSNLIGAGPGSYADELVRMVGGTNVLATTGIRYPKISRESLERLEIDLVIDSSGTALESMSVWPEVAGRTVAAMPTSAATPRPDVTGSLVGVGDLVAKAAASGRQAP